MLSSPAVWSNKFFTVTGATVSYGMSKANCGIKASTFELKDNLPSDIKRNTPIASTDFVTEPTCIFCVAFIGFEFKRLEKPALPTLISLFETVDHTIPTSFSSLVATANFVAEIINKNRNNRKYKLLNTNSKAPSAV